LSVWEVYQKERHLPSTDAWIWTLWTAGTAVVQIQFFAPQNVFEKFIVDLRFKRRKRHQGSNAKPDAIHLKAAPTVLPNDCPFLRLSSYQGTTVVALPLHKLT
jgi:hypothetical protein